MSFCYNVKSTLTTMKMRTDICDIFFILTTGSPDKQNDCIQYVWMKLHNYFILRNCLSRGPVVENVVLK